MSEYEKADYLKAFVDAMIHCYKDMGGDLPPSHEYMIRFLMHPKQEVEEKTQLLTEDN